jgi:hypothetical protein
MGLSNAILKYRTSSADIDLAPDSISDTDDCLNRLFRRVLLDSFLFPMYHQNLNNLDYSG